MIAPSVRTCLARSSPARGLFQARVGLLSLSLALLAPFPAAAQRDEIAPQLVLTPGSGLPGGPAQELFQDATGFLWIASWQGVARYDGVRLTQLYDECCVKSMVVADGLLWVAATTTDRLDDFLVAVPPSGSGISSHFTARINKLLAHEKSLFVLGEGGLHQVPSSAEAPVELLPSPLVDGEITGDSILLLGPSNVIRYRPGGLTPETTLVRSDVEETFQRLAALGDGSFWVATGSFLRHFTPAGRPLGEIALPVDTTGRPIRVTDLVEGHFGALWISSLAGVFVLDDRSHEYQRVTHAPAQRLLLDRSGTLWIGEESAIKRITPTQLVFRRSPSGPLENIEIVSLLERGDSVLVGSRVGLFSARLDSLHLEPNTPDVPKVISLEAAPSGEVFMGTYGEGVHVWEPVADRIRQLRLRTSEEEDDGVVDIEIDPSGGAWFATYSSGLWYADPPYVAARRVIAAVDERAEPAWPPIYALAISSDGRSVWLAERGKGLSRYDPVTGISIVVGGAEFENLMDLHFDHRGHLLAGSRGGELFDFADPGGDEPEALRLTVPNFGGRLASIRMIREDAQGFIWLITDAGLTRLDLTGTASPISFVEAHQLPLRGMHRQAALITSSNGLLLGTTEGLVSLDIDALATLGASAPLTLTSSLPAITGNQIVLPYSARSLTLEAALLDLTDPARNLYSFRLAGAEAEWSRPSTNPRVTYASLEPGSYTLQVRAADSLGVWTPEPLSVPVVVRPHPALTGPALALWAVLVAVSSTLLARRYVAYRQRLAARQLSDQRTILAQERMIGERSLALEQSRGVLLEVGHLHDGLTGLPNRSAWRTVVLPSILDASLEPHGLALVEVEGLRALNIRHSAATSDRVLKHVAERLRREPAARRGATSTESPSRQGPAAPFGGAGTGGRDVLLRWAGDQFLLALPVEGFEALQAAIAKVVAAARQRPEELPPFALSAAFTLYPVDAGEGCPPLHMVHLLELALAWGRSRASGFLLGLRPRPPLTATPLTEVLDHAAADFASLHSLGFVAFETAASALLPAPLPFRSRS